MDEQQPIDASLEFAGTAKTIAKALHKPETYDDKLIHSHIERGYEADIMLTSAIPFDMAVDFEKLKLDSLKAAKELEELKEKAPHLDNEPISEELVMEALRMEVEEQEVTDEEEWREYWSGVLKDVRAYNMAWRVVQSRILTDDDVLAWEVMQPFCGSLPTYLVETFMARDGKRAEHGVKNIAAILSQEQALAEASAGHKLLGAPSRMVRKIFGEH